MEAKKDSDVPVSDNNDSSSQSALENPVIQQVADCPTDVSMATSNMDTTSSVQEQQGVSVQDVEKKTKLQPIYGEFDCFYCDATLTERNEFMEHMAIHETEPIKCIKCGTICNSSFEMLNHYEIHTEENVFVCMCGKLFQHLSKLREHHSSTHVPNA